MNDYDIRKTVNDNYSLRGRVFQKIREDILSGKYKEHEELKELPSEKNSESAERL